METTDKDNVVPPENGSEVSESSADKTWDSEKYILQPRKSGKKKWTCNISKCRERMIKWVKYTNVSEGKQINPSF